MDLLWVEEWLSFCRTAYCRAVPIWKCPDLLYMTACIVLNFSCLFFFLCGVFPSLSLVICVFSVCVPVSLSHCLSDSPTLMVRLPDKHLWMNFHPCVLKFSLSVSLSLSLSFFLSPLPPNPFFCCCCPSCSVCSLVVGLCRAETGALLPALGPGLCQYPGRHEVRQTAVGEVLPCCLLWTGASLRPAWVHFSSLHFFSD